MKRLRTFTSITITILICVGVLGSLPGIVSAKDQENLLTQTQAVYPVGPTSTNWVLTFGDEFNGTALDRTVWKSDYYNGGNGELQEYVNDDSMGNYLVQNGMLRIVAKKEAYQGRNYTSGMISTQNRFFQKYGYFEIRAKVPAGNGYWPAFWLLPNPTGWPPEIDVMEYLGKDRTTVHMTLHYNDSTRARAQSGSHYTGPDFSAGWHTFGVDWQQGSMVWYVDGVARKQITNTSIIPNIPMYILANLAVGGNWPGSPDGTTVFPGYYDIDYIRVWQKSSAVIPTPLPTNDVVKNGSFDDPNANPWYFPWEMRNDLAATFTKDSTTSANGSSSFKTNLMTANASQPWVVSLLQKDKTLTAGQSYTLTFWAKASINRTLRVDIQEQNSPFTEYYTNTANLTSAWTKYSYTFTAPTSTVFSKLNFSLAGNTGNVWLDAISFCSTSAGCGSITSPTATATSAQTQPTSTAISPTRTPLPTMVAPSATPTRPPLPTTVAPSATPTQYLPIISITSPQDRSSVRRRSNVTITAAANSANGVAKVEFRINGNLICTKTASPYSCVWRVPNTTGRRYTIEAKVYDLAQKTATTSITVTSRR